MEATASTAFRQTPQAKSPETLRALTWFTGHLLASQDPGRTGLADSSLAP